MFEMWVLFMASNILFVSVFTVLGIIEYVRGYVRSEHVILALFVGAIAYILMPLPDFLNIAILLVALFFVGLFSFIELLLTKWKKPIKHVVGTPTSLVIMGLPYAFIMFFLVPLEKQASVLILGILGSMLAFILHVLRVNSCNCRGKLTIPLFFEVEVQAECARNKGYFIPSDADPDNREEIERIKSGWRDGECVKAYANLPLLGLYTFFFISITVPALLRELPI